MMNLKALRFLPVLLMICISACEKTIIKDTSLVDDKDGLSFRVTDTLTINATTVKGFTFRTDNLATYAAGRINDPVFGVNEAYFSTHLRIPSNNVDLGTGLTLDSVVLMLRPAENAYYGDNAQAVSFVVYEVNEDIVVGEEYKSDVIFTTSTNEIGRLDNVIPNLADSITVDSIVLPAHIRIPLEKSFWQNVFNQSGTPNMSDNTAFRDYLNGIQIKVDPNLSGSVMYYFNLVSVFSKVAFYYRNAEGDNLTFDLLISNESVKVNHYTHDFAGSFVENYIQESISDSNDETIFLKSMGGTIGKIELPYIEAFRNKIINKAELIVTLKGDPLSTVNDSLYPAPARLTINAVQEDGQPQFIVDQFVSAEYFGGFQTTVESDGETFVQYRFNVARYLQDLLKKEQLEPHQKHLYLLTFPADRIADRAVVGGKSSAEKGLRLKITYTNIE